MRMETRHNSDMSGEAGRVEMEREITSKGLLGGKMYRNWK